MVGDPGASSSGGASGEPGAEAEGSAGWKGAPGGGQAGDLGEPGGPSWREESWKKNREESHVTQGEPPRHHPATVLSPSLPAQLQRTVTIIVPSPISPKPCGQEVPAHHASTRAASCVTQPRQLPEVPIPAACPSGQGQAVPRALLLCLSSPVGARQPSTCRDRYGEEELKQEEIKIPPP